MNRYESYQNVESDWYDEVPQRWTKTKNKYIFTQDIRIVGQEWENFTLLTMGKSGVKPRDMGGGGKFPASFENYQVVDSNQLIFCLFDLDETPRIIGLSKDHGMITSAYDVFSTTPQNDPQYWTYFYQTIDDHKGFRPYYTGLRKVVRLGTFLGIEVFSPSYKEQKIISRYLDKKTQTIDNLIQKIEKKIELLKELRASLINEAVTKGLNPNVEMKDSGVEWIGKIPLVWDKMRLRFAGNIYGGLTGKRGGDFNQEDNPNNKPYIPYTNIFRNTYISKDHFDYVVLEKNERQNLVKKNDLFFLMSSETYQDLGKSCILIDDVEELYLNSFCKGFRITKGEINPLFINYQLLGHIFKEIISIEGRGFTRINLRQSRLLDIPLFIPPQNEQQKIVAYLNQKTKLIDDSISKEQKRIELLNEYKESLISEVVTGKKRVTEEMI